MLDLAALPAATSPPTSPIEAEDFGYAPFDPHGGLGKVHQLFGVGLPKVIEALNQELAA